MIDLSFLQQLKKFSLIVRKRVTSKYVGEKRSIATGGGIVFKDYRIYAPGDDFRGIDWRVYARTDDLMVKTFEEERNMEVHIIIDASKSMDFGSPTSKFDYAAMLGVGFAYLSLKDNTKFQFSAFSDELEVYQSKKGMHQLALMVDYLNKIKTKGSSHLLDAVLQYKTYMSSKSLIILISDFLIDPKEIEEALTRLGKHEVKVIQVLDKVEREIAVEGDYMLKDAETNEMLRTFVTNRLRLKFRDDLDHHTAQINDICSRFNAQFYKITTDTPLFDAFFEILK